VSLREGILGVGAWRYSWYTFSSSVLNGVLLDSRPGRYTPAERARGVHWIESCAKPTKCLDCSKIGPMFCR